MSTPASEALHLPGSAPGIDVPPLVRARGGSSVRQAAAQGIDAPPLVRARRGAAPGIDLPPLVRPNGYEERPQMAENAREDADLASRRGRCPCGRCHRGSQKQAENDRNGQVTKQTHTNPFQRGDRNQPPLAVRPAPREVWCPGSVRKSQRRALWLRCTGEES